MEVGLVLTQVDGVARVVALDLSFIGELLLLTLVKAITLNLEVIITGLSVLGNDRDVEQGDLAERTYAELLIQVGFFLIGRIIDPAANFLDMVQYKRLIGWIA
jgi:F0F1-type ATP synthase alpha subunit